MNRPARTAAFCALSLLVACGADEGQGWFPWFGGGDVPAVSAQALREASDPRVRRFYEQNHWRPVWSPRRAEALIAVIGRAQRHGIDPQRFLASIDQAEEPAAREEALTLAAISYAQALAMGIADPKKLHGIYTVDRPSADLVSGLAEAVRGDHLRDWLEGLAPQDAEYKALSKAYLEAVRRMGDAQAAPIPPGDLIHPGEHDARVPAIAAALGVGTNPEEPELYGPDIAAAMKRFQAERGVADDGVVGPDTLELLNTGPADRARTLVLNLERLRWRARARPDRRVEVNIAAALLTYYEGGRPVWRTRVIAGQPSKKTPMLSALMTRLVVNPPWVVPKGIAEEEILPKGQGYLTSHDMYVEDGQVIQRPGPNASLGQVKFDLDDPYAIYLHDTPAKSLFEDSERHRSHGCVRVQNAIDFGRRLAAKEGKGAEFDRELASGETQSVDLAQPIAVILFYQTAYLDEDGEVAYRPDVYHWDEKLADALGVKAPSRYAGAEPAAADLGP